MFTSPGFLGTDALLFMDIATIYFVILPFLLIYSINFARKKEYKKHFLSQSLTLALTLGVVLIFEIGVRLTGGFFEYVKNSSVSYDFLLVFLIVHIIIAIFAVGGWLYLYISAYKEYRNNGFINFKGSNHRKIGKAIFLALSITAFMGLAIYIFLFIL
jgi:putative membrane protein